MPHTKNKALKLALIQANIIWKDPERNRLLLSKTFSKMNKKVDAIILPEMFTSGFVSDPSSVAEKPNGDTFNWLKKEAELMKTAICGSFVVEENNKYYNRLLWMNSDGTYQQYDKKHLFSLGKEHLEYTSGKYKIIFEFNGWKICPMICYDLRFPAWARNSTNKDEDFLYDILIYVANWPSSRRLHWRYLLMARAIENQCYAIGVNRLGKDGNGWKYDGGSTFANPDGYWFPEKEKKKKQVIFIELDKENLRKSRKNFPFWKDWDKFKLDI